MSKHLMPSLNGKIEQEDKFRGFNLSILEPGTRIMLETANSFYDLVIVEGSQATIFGGTTLDWSLRYSKPTPIVIHGSTWGTSILKVDWIGFKMRMEYKESESDLIMTTSPVQNATLDAPDGRWHFRCDWKKVWSRS